jgi:hypothetical protein
LNFMNSHFQESSVNSLELGVRLVKIQESFEFAGLLEFIEVTGLLSPNKSIFTMKHASSLRGAEGDEAISVRGM